MDTKQKLRTQLVLLKSDIEDVFSDIAAGERVNKPVFDKSHIDNAENFFRGSVERVMADIERCDLRGAIEDMQLIDTGKILLNEFDAGRRMASIHDELIEFIVETATKQCKCRVSHEENIR